MRRGPPSKLQLPGRYGLMTAIGFWAAPEMNVPTCPRKARRPVRPVRVPLRSSVAGNNMLMSCTSTITKFPGDVQGFIDGYAVISLLRQAS
jgi:hypothetical protein